MIIYTKEKPRRTLADVRKELIHLKHNDMVTHTVTGEVLVIGKEQTVQLSSRIETANGKRYLVGDIDAEGRVYVR